MIIPFDEMSDKEIMLRYIYILWIITDFKLVVLIAYPMFSVYILIIPYYPFPFNFAYSCVVLCVSCLSTHFNIYILLA